jgi:hypothetical protein
MGLYLCVFDGEEEIEGVELGHYADFGDFRDTVMNRLEAGRAGSRFPVLMIHSDCDGELSPAEAAALSLELKAIESELSRLPPIQLKEGWRRSVAKSLGIAPRNLAECFFDIDGEPLFDRLKGLCAVSATKRLPILFQ